MCKKLKDRIEQLEELAYVDVLTNCYTRAAFEEFKPKCTDAALYVTFVDVNGLKVVNDRLGHEQGDELLKYVSYMLKHLSKKNVVFRLGGDEFIILGHQRIIINMPEVSYGIVYKEKGKELDEVLPEAEHIMKTYKKENFFARRETLERS